MSSSNYDVLVAGGSVAGLLTARELASRGISVVVVEEHHEIGTPEHCGGMVSAQGLNKLGIMPDSNVFQNFVTKTIITSPSSRVELNSEHQNVVVIDRRALDKQIAHQAQRVERLSEQDALLNPLAVTEQKGLLQKQLMETYLAFILLMRGELHP